jgi:outer membrane protein assembly factor BamD (BamD/ComL family)
MQKTKSVVSTIFLGALLAAPGFCREISPVAVESGGGAAANSTEEALYSNGTRAINDGRWSDAATIFGKIAQQHGQRAEASLYWKAYAENKEGKTANALESCKELRRAYPQGQWINECGALEIEIRGKSGDPVSPQAEQDEDLKLLALNSLMQQDEARALPVIQQILDSNRSDKLKDRALFVLAQNQSSQAQQLLGQIARGQKDPALQKKAVQMLAVTQGKQAAPVLADIYRQSRDEQVKKAVLNAYMIMGTPDPVEEAARHESNPELAKAAVNELGAMGATSQLLALYQEATNPETKAAIINAFVPAGPRGSDALGKIATTEHDPELRRKAIRNLGITGGTSAAPMLMTTYRQNGDVETKKAVVEALFLANDSHDLVELARAEKDPAVKQKIVQQLSLIHDKEATDYMLEILNK